MSVIELIDALKNSDKNIRLSAAEVLGSIGDKSAVPALVEALKDPEKRVSREEGRYEKQLEYAEYVVSQQIPPESITALQIFSLWLKTHAELKLNRPQDALKSIKKAEELLGYLSPVEKESYWELFKEYTLVYEGRSLCCGR